MFTIHSNTFLKDGKKMGTYSSNVSYSKFSEFIINLLQFDLENSLVPSVQLLPNVEAEMASLATTSTLSPGLIIGTPGNDITVGTNQSDRIFGFDGDDGIFSLDGDDVVFGGAGVDIIIGGGGNDLLFGEDGNDLIFGDSQVFGVIGNDIIFGGEGFDVLFGGAGNDGLDGDNGDDVLHGEDGNDILNGGNGNDNLNGGAGNDILEGDDGDDFLSGGDEADILNGGNGNDRMFGDAGDDLLNGNAGDDIINGGDGNDLAFGGLGNDRFFLGAGNDQVFGEDGNDLADGGAGDDLLDGGDGTDILFGSLGNDSLVGGDDDDFLVAGVGNDSLSGDAGNDTLIGVDPFVPAFGFGQGEIDTLSGGEGVDTFVLGQDDQVFYVGEGNNDYALITDFIFGEDIIQFAENPTGSVSVSEAGDAGQTLFDAQVIPGGSGTLDSITGTVANNNDVDLFQISLAGGGTFSATTVGGATFDTQLFLFDDDGLLVRQNDDSSGTLQSTISDSPFAPLAPGTYFLAISSFNNDPVGSPPSFPGRGGSSGDYTIELSGVEATPPTFSFGASPDGLPEGTGIFFGDDLIAILQDTSPFGPSLNSDSLLFA